MTSKQIHSVMIFFIAILFTFATATIGVACSSDAPPANDGPNAWNISTTCTEAGVYNLLGSEWTCVPAGAGTMENAYTCIVESAGGEVDKCAKIKCGDHWEDEAKNLVFFHLNYFRRSKDGVEIRCTLVPPVKGSVKTVGPGWWKSEAVGPYTALSKALPGEFKVEILFGNDPTPSKAGCGLGENYIRILFEGKGNENGVWCIPSTSTGYDLHAPYNQTGLMKYTAYVMQSDAGFTDCPGGGHVKIVIKEDYSDGGGYSGEFSYTMCKVKKVK